MERPVDRAFIGNFHQLAAFLIRQIAGDLDLTLDMIDLAGLGLAIRAIFSVNLIVTQRYRYLFKLKPLAPGIHAHGH